MSSTRTQLRATVATSGNGRPWRLPFSTLTNAGAVPTVACSSSGTCGEATGLLAKSSATTYAKRFTGFESWRARDERDEGSFRLRPFLFRPRRVKLFDERNLGGGRFVEVMIPRPGKRPV